MPRTADTRPSSAPRKNAVSMRRPLMVLSPALAASLTLAACGGSSYGGGSSSSAAKASTPAPAGAAAVKTTANASLGATVLTDTNGMTLYSLSAEQNGRFICTSAPCTQAWHALLTTSSGTPVGVASLATIVRPDGTRQVTYKGLPLYTFAQDRRPGEANGQGVKDVGTWSAATVGSAAAAAPGGSTTSSTTSSTPAPAGRSGY